MPNYIIIGNGKKVHIIGKSDKATLCGVIPKYDGYARYPTKEDGKLETCWKCQDIIMSIVNA